MATYKQAKEFRIFTFRCSTKNWLWFQVKKILPRYSLSTYQDGWNIYMFGTKVPLCWWPFWDDWIQKSEFLHFWRSSVIFHIKQRNTSLPLTRWVLVSKNWQGPHHSNSRRIHGNKDHSLSMIKKERQSETSILVYNGQCKYLELRNL